MRNRPDSGLPFFQREVDRPVIVAFACAVDQNVTATKFFLHEFACSNNLILLGDVAADRNCLDTVLLAERLCVFIQDLKATRCEYDIASACCKRICAQNAKAGRTAGNHCYSAMIIKHFVVSFCSLLYLY